MTFLLPGISLAGRVLAFGAYIRRRITRHRRRRPLTALDRGRWLTILDVRLGVVAGVATVL